MSRLGPQRPHARAFAVLAKQPVLPGCLIGKLSSKRSVAFGTLIEARQPASELNGPEREVAQRPKPASGALNLSRCQQNQAKHGFCGLMLRQDLLGSLADHGQAGAEGV